MHVYPRAIPVPPAVPAFDSVACAARVIELREADKEITFEQALGHCLKVSGGTSADVKRVWDEVEADRVKLRQVNPAAFNTLTEYKTGLGMVAKHLDPTDWYDGLKSEIDVTTWIELKEHFAAIQDTIELVVPK